jgi:hypothetical protein
MRRTFIEATGTGIVGGVRASGAVLSAGLISIIYLSSKSHFLLTLRPSRITSSILTKIVKIADQYILRFFSLVYNHKTAFTRCIS